MSHDSTSTVSIRPYGYVSDQPVCHRIGDWNLFVGNAAAAEYPPAAGRFDAVLSLTADPRPATTHHRPLVDGGENEWAAFESAADTACALHDAQGTLFVHCKAGVSRSAAVAATAMAATESRRFVDALHELQDAHPDAVPHPALHEQGVCYLAARR